MPDLPTLLILLIFSFPLLGGILTLVLKERIIKRIFWFEIGLVIAGLLGLVVLGKREIITPLSFMEEPITFSIATTPILIFLGSLLILLHLVWRHSRSGESPPTRFQTLLVSFSLSFGFIAFISGQFMIRYIALDIVGLLAALTVLSTFAESAPMNRFVVIFQTLRFGDLSLLASILVINAYVGTLDISQMITASMEMPINTRTWVYLGFFTAILIKLAIWPFGIWLRLVRDSAEGGAYWISGLLMPSLGYYLLYRITPLIGSHSGFQNFTLYFTIMLLVLIILTDLLQLVTFDRVTQMGGVMSCFLLWALAIGAEQFLVIYILALILYRWALLIREHTENQLFSHIITLLPLVLNGFYLWFNLDDFPIVLMLAWAALTTLVMLWDVWVSRREQTGKRAQAFNKGSQPNEGFLSKGLTNTSSWLNKNLEMDIFGTEVYRFSDSFVRFADWIRESVEQRLEGLLSWIGQNLIKISEGTLFKVEVEAAEKTTELMDDALESLEAYEENVLKKTLRWDLAWIPLLLAVILILLFIT